MKRLIASDAQTNDIFGWRVAISGDIAVVGAQWEDAGGSTAGAVYVFGRNMGGADNWGEAKKVTASDAQAGDLFGGSVSISGDTIVVGAFFEDAGGANSGAVYLFQRNEGGADSWGQVKKLTASDAQMSDEFGYSVAINSNTAVVGARFEDAGGSDAGAGYVYQRDQGGAGNWGETKKLIASDAENNDEFGFSVALSGDTAIVGARNENTGGLSAGAGYVFGRNQGGAENWGEVKKLTASDAQAVDAFGTSVAASGDTAVVGADIEDTVANNAGAAYVFDLLLPKPTATPRPTSGPKPVGGIALDADLRPLALETGGPSGSTWGIALAIVAAVSLIAVGGAVVYVRRRAGDLGDT